MENIKRFAKRIDLWSEYRIEIERNALKNNSTLFENRKLKKMIENINDLDDAIINFSTKQELELTQTQMKKYGVNDHYKLLSIKLDTLSPKLIDEINSGIKAADNIKDNYFCLDKNLQLSSSTMGKFATQNNALVEIDDRIKQMREVLAHFPATAKTDLAELNVILEEVKAKIQDQEITNRVTTSKIDLTYDVKRFYVISIWAIVIISVICLILAICLISF